MPCAISGDMGLSVRIIKINRCGRPWRGFAKRTARAAAIHACKTGCLAKPLWETLRQVANPWQAFDIILQFAIGAMVRNHRIPALSRAWTGEIDTAGLSTPALPRLASSGAAAPGAPRSGKRKPWRPTRPPGDIVDVVQRLRFRHGLLAVQLDREVRDFLVAALIARRHGKA